MTFVPIRIDVQAEDEYRASLPWHSRVMKWLSRWSPLLIYYEIPYGRVSLESQLRSRTEFPGQVWESRGFTVDQVKEVLNVLAVELNLPNNYLIPEDPLDIVLIPDYDDLPISSLRNGLQSNLNVDFRLDELVNLAADSMTTVESFIREVSRRRLRLTHC